MERVVNKSAVDYSCCYPQLPRLDFPLRLELVDGSSSDMQQQARSELVTTYSRVESTAGAGVTTFHPLPSIPEMEMQMQMQAQLQASSSQLYWGSTSGFSQRELFDHHRIETHQPQSCFYDGDQGAPKLVSGNAAAAHSSIPNVNRECKKDPEEDDVYERQIMAFGAPDYNGYNEGQQQLVPGWIGSAATIRQHMMEMSCVPGDLEIRQQRMEHMEMSYRVPAAGDTEGHAGGSGIAKLPGSNVEDHAYSLHGAMTSEEAKWCPVCAANGSSQCLCGIPAYTMHAAASDVASLSVQGSHEPSYTNYVHWLTIQSIMNMQRPDVNPAPPQHLQVHGQQLTGAASLRDTIFISASQTPPAGMVQMVQTETLQDQSTTVHDDQQAAAVMMSHQQQQQQQQQKLVQELKEANHPHTPSQDDIVFGGQGTRNMAQGEAAESAEEAAVREEVTAARKKAEEWEMVRYKAMIVAHPLYLRLLAVHAECLRIGTPIDQLPGIDMQMERYMDVTNKYLPVLMQLDTIGAEEQAELDDFMTQYIALITAFKDHMQQHVYTDVAEAMMSCWELEQTLCNYTGQACPLESTGGATMSDSDSDNDIIDDEYGYELPLPAMDQLDQRAGNTYSAMVTSETDRALMERVRQELKQELKEGYRAKIEEVREEILRKRRAGKLPDGTTTVLKAWWNNHSKWPYPTEEEKEGLIQETGLELKQVNNWFINQRKRNWHSNPLAASSSADVSMQQRSKRKSW